MEDEYEFKKKVGVEDAVRLITFVIVAVVGIILLIGFAPLAKNILGGEREGLVNIEECLEIVKVKEGSFTTYVNKFTCNYGFCCRAEVKDGACKTAFCYSKEEVSN